jgi:hypothetical protein
MLIFSFGPSVVPPDRRGENGGRLLGLSGDEPSGNKLIMNNPSRLVNG